MERDELVTLTDIANRLEVSKRTVIRWRDEVDGWPMSDGTVTRQGRKWTAYSWQAVMDFCETHGLPDRTRQEGVRRSKRPQGQ